MSQEEKNKLISAGGTLISMGIVLIFLLLCGFTQETPPPPAKKIIMVELDEEIGGGGGGGGTPQKTSNRQSAPSENIVTEDSPNAPTTHRPANRKTTPDNSQPVQQVNKGALFNGTGGGSGSGKGTGTGSGSGSGRGTGIGNGDGSGIGSGIGEGTGTRGMRKTPNLRIDVQENGKVFVEVHIDAEGNVIGARVVSDKRHPTNITNSEIRQECIRRAKEVKYAAGKEEFRFILFTP